MTKLPRITWFDYKGIKTPYEMFFEGLDAMGEKVQGIFATWLAKQATCEYMLWNYILDFYETGEVVQEDTTYSVVGNEMHNELAFGTKTSPLVDEFRKGNSFLQWRSIEDLNKYQQNRLASIHDGKITEYSMLGEIAGLKVRGTFDAFDLASGTLLEFKTRARPTIPYFHEKKNKMQLLTYYFLVKNYNKELNCKDLPVEKLSEYAKIQYISQADHRLLGELVIHVPYETERYMKMMKFYKEFWLGTRRPAFSLKYCVFCKFQANCYFHKKFYHPGFYKPGKNEDRDDQA